MRLAECAKQDESLVVLLIARSEWLAVHEEEMSLLEWWCGIWVIGLYCVPQKLLLTGLEPATCGS